MFQNVPVVDAQRKTEKQITEELKDVQTCLKKIMGCNFAMCCMQGWGSYVLSLNYYA